MLSCSCFWLILVALTILDIFSHDFQMESDDWEFRIQVNIFPGGVFLASFWIVFHLAFLAPKKKKILPTLPDGSGKLSLSQIKRELPAIS